MATPTFRGHGILMAILRPAAYALLLMATSVRAFSGAGVSRLSFSSRPQAAGVCRLRPRVQFAQQRSSAGGAHVTMAVKTEEKGTFPSEEYRMYLTNSKSGKSLSPWHGLPTWADKKAGIVHAVIEITKNTRPKMEVATKESSNPIKQDMKKGKLRDYPLDIFWNYGMIPQTWENPNAEHKELKAFGDNDPVDIVEIGSAPLARGSVVEVKALGTLAMIDEGELDWKVIGISTKVLSLVALLVQKCKF